MRFTIALTILASLLAVEAAPTPTPTKRCATNIECLKERALIAAARLEVRDPPAGDKVRRQAASAALPPRPTSTTTLYTQTGKQAIRLAAGRYEIAAWGAQGGSALVSGGTQLAGGTAANINSTFVFNQANDVVLIIAGRGGNEPVGSTGANAGGAGGGGGSFVYTSTGTPILIAGGGGGSAFNRDVSPASTGTSGTQGRGGGGVGGTNGSGGGASNVNGQALVSGGGAGFFSDGMPSSNAASGRSRPNFNGGVGSSARGGFGGGGGGGRSAGGGGGGYSGGGAGREGGSSSGGGGGSFSNSNFRVTTVPVAAVNNWAGSGQILIRGPL